MDLLETKLTILIFVGDLEQGALPLPAAGKEQIGEQRLDGT